MEILFNMSKDKIYGAIIALLFLVILIFYFWVVFLPYTNIAFSLNLGSWVFSDMKWVNFFIMLPVFGGVALFSFIFIWIGYTMATTPPPEPIDLDSLDLDDDEEEAKSA